MWWIIIFIIWILKIFVANSEPSSKESRVTFAFFYPLVALGMAFIWNIYARHIIGWPEIKTLEEFVLVMMLF